jgi:hypothetical protein
MLVAHRCGHGLQIRAIVPTTFPRHRGLAIAFLDRIDEAKKYITDFPLAFQIKYKNVRTALLEQFPYHIHYIVDDTKKQIVVLAVTHAYRNPKDYSNR